MNELKNKSIQLREFERQRDDKLNIIRSMTIAIDNHNAESCATSAVAAGKETPRRRPPTPYTLRKKGVG